MKTMTFPLAISFSLLLLSFSACAPHHSNRVEGLTCEYLTDTPLVEQAHPRLAWRFVSDDDGQRQTAWQVLAATAPDKLSEKEADLWNSGKVVSSQSTQLRYGGNPPAPRQRVWWKVRVWGRHGHATPWSAPACWERALPPQAWEEARWIGSPVQPPAVPGGPNPAYYFRKEIILPAGPADARAYISGLGYYELYINGQRVGDHRLAPAHSNYGYRDTARFPFHEVRHMSYRVYYDRYDITSLLHEGKNSVGVILGNGWYFQHEREEDTSYTYGLPRLIARVEAQLPGGRRIVLTTDTTWKTSTGPLLHNGIYTGEIYDARRTQKGWATPPYDDNTWAQAVIRSAPQGRLMPCPGPPDRIIREVKSAVRTRVNDSTWRYDLGEMISGWARLRVQGRAGTRITLRFEEENGPEYGQTDTYILRGEAPEVWEPRFTWHAFRNVLVTCTVPPDTFALTGVVVNTDVPVTGSFHCSNELFNRLNDNFIRTQQGNMHGGVPSDCPHRERRGYTGDGQIAAPAALYNFDMRAFYTKWVEDIADAQNKVTGFVPYTAPFQSGWGGTPWGSAFIIIPWYMYLHYADTAIVRRHWEGIKKYITYLENRLVPPGIVDEALLGEWVPPAPETIPKNLVSTAYFHYDLLIMTRLAAALGKDDEAARFRTLAARVKEGFNKKYFHKEKMSYSIGYQGANVFALGYRLVPEQYVKGVFRTLTDHLINETGGHFDTGMMGTPLLLEVLTRYGRNDLAYSLMNQKDFPSFGPEILGGATTLWETWDGVLSHDHPMFGSVCAWFYYALAGLRPDDGDPGFRHVIIRPLPVAGLHEASAACLTPYGRLRSSWHLDDAGTFTLTVTVPPGSRATVYVPAHSEKTVGVTGQYSQPHTGIVFDGMEDESAVYQILSGTYRFVSRQAAGLLPRALVTAPVVRPADTLVTGGETLRVTMETDEAGGVIRYTLDGTLPDTLSPVYEKPLLLHDDTRLIARVFAPGKEAGPVTQRRYFFSDPAVNGFRYLYYSGLWQQVPDFSRLTPAATGALRSLDLDALPHNKDRFALLLTAWLEVPATGTYTFLLTSNDGSRLYIDGKEVIDNDGPHPARERRGSLYLTKGKHLIRIGYMQVGGGYALSLAWIRPDGTKEPVPPDLFFRKK